MSLKGALAALALSLAATSATACSNICAVERGLSFQVRQRYVDSDYVGLFAKDGITASGTRSRTGVIVAPNGSALPAHQAATLGQRVARRARCQLASYGTTSQGYIAVTLDCPPIR